jgi:ABC-type multidrug transport system fused ATPase/permease subunit
MVEVRDVTYRYDDTSNVLNGISMIATTGQVTALVGSSGAGKSTLIKLLLGLCTPQSGTIHIKGVEQDGLTADLLRDQFAYVAQDAPLFNCTIEENIRYGNLNATKEEVIRAAQAAHVHDFVMSLPQGYATSVGEYSAKVSGGERQRIAMARALLTDAPILLLDEATSALDVETEALVQKTMQTLMQGRTTIVIAHRLSTIQTADRIYVLDQGSIVEAGDHESLLDNCGIYKTLYESQFCI